MKNLLLVLSTFYFISGVAQIPSNGLIGAWTFSGSANDVSGFNNHGVVFGASLTADRCGNSNSAYYFNGASYILMPNYGPLGSSPRSVSMWVKTSYTTTNAVASFDYGSANGSAGNFQIVHNYNCQGVGVDISNQAFIKGNSCLNNDTWHHIVAVFDATVSSTLGNIYIYIDGVAQTPISCAISGTTSAINTVTQTPITIGKHIFNNNGRFFIGAIDDIYLYNRALSPAEVQLLYLPCNPSVYGPTAVCAQSTVIYSVNPIPGATSYSWSLPSGWSGSSTSNTIAVTSGTNAGVVNVLVNSSSCGSLATASTAVSTSSMGLNISISSSSSLVCPGSPQILTATGSASSYTWQVLPPVIGNTLSVSPMVNTTYVVVGSNSLGCTSSISYTASVSPLPTITIGPNTATLCNGAGMVLTASGASSYSWHVSPSVGANTLAVSPATNTSYTVSGSNSAGCTNTTSILVSVIPNPTILINATNTFVCKGSKVILTGSGGTTYTWQPGSVNGSTVAVIPSQNSIYTLTGVGSGTCATTSTIQINVKQCTGLGEQQIQAKISIFPNPSSERIYINSNEELSLVIYNMLGQEIEKVSMHEGENVLMISHLKNGIYLIKIDNNQYRNESWRFVKID